MATDAHKRKDAPLWLLIIVGIAIAIAVPTGIACIVNHQMITGLVIMGCALATLVIVIAGFPTAKASADTVADHDEEPVANVRKTSSSNAASSHDENVVIKSRVRRTSTTDTGAAVPNNHGFATSGVTARLAAKAAAEAAQTNTAASTTTSTDVNTVASAQSVTASNSRTPQQRRQQHNTAKPREPQEPQPATVNSDKTIVSANNMTVSGRIPCTVTITTRSIIITPKDAAYEQMTLKRSTPILDVGSDKMLALAGPQTATTMLSHADPRVIAVLRKAVETGEIKRPKKKTSQPVVPQQQPVVQSQRQRAKPNRTLTANQSTPRPANSPRRTTTISFH